MQTYAPDTPLLAPKTQWILKSLQFLIWSASGLFFPFINMYYRGLGLSGTQIGLIGCLASLLSAGSSVLFGLLSDRLGRVRWLFVVGNLGTIGFVLALGGVSTFWVILPVAGLLAMFNTPLYSLLNSTIVSLLGKRSADYGGYRMWGTIGFVITSSVGGLLFASAGLHAMFPAFAVASTLFMLLAFIIPAPPRHAKAAGSGSLRQMVRQPAWLRFMLAVFILWFAVMGGYSFLGVMMKDMGAAENLVGWSSTVNALAEIPFLWASARLLRRFGPLKLMKVAFIVYIFRNLCYAVVPAPPWVLLINLTQGLSYVLFLIGSIALADELAPAALRGTAQGLLMTVMNIANLFGVLISGWLYDVLGSGGLYVTLGGVCLLGLILFEGSRRGQQQVAEA